MERIEIQQTGAQRPQSVATRNTAEDALSRHSAFFTMTLIPAAMATVLALDIALIRENWLVSHFMSEHVGQGHGTLMTAVFIMMALSAWSYVVARHNNWLVKNNLVVSICTFLFGLGLFTAGCFAMDFDGKPANFGFWHNVGAGLAFLVATVAMLIDVWPVRADLAKKHKLSLLALVLTLVGAVMFLLLLATRGALDPYKGLIQRTWAFGLLVWLATEAHQLFWTSSSESENVQVRS
jgi:hypothetical protein